MKRNLPLPTAGGVYGCLYPFQRTTYEAFDADSEGIGVTTVPGWRPGVYEHVYDPGWPGDGDVCNADGAGKLILTVISVHKPGKFQTRVFFIRQWETPEGHRFGKGRLEVVTLGKFWRTASRYHFNWRTKDRGVEAIMAKEGTDADSES